MLSTKTYTSSAIIISRAVCAKRPRLASDSALVDDDIGESGEGDRDWDGEDVVVSVSIPGSESRSPVTVGSVPEAMVVLVKYNDMSVLVPTRYEGV